MYLPISQGNTSEYIFSGTPSPVIQKPPVRNEFSWLALPEESLCACQIKKSWGN